jgi:polysaccharide export outer membrane protein
VSIRQTRHLKRRSACFLAFILLLAEIGPWARTNLHAQHPVVTEKSARTAGYNIQVGDTLSVFYRLTPEYNQTLTVLPDGNLTLHLIGCVHVAGLDVEEARSAITHEAAKRLRDPDVSVSVSDFVHEQFSVMGEVSRPGRFELHGVTNLVDALASAGGFTNNSAQRRVILVKPLGQTSEYGNATVFDFKTLTSLIHSSSVPLLGSGDIVIVTTSKFAKVSGVVKLVNFGVFYNPLTGS